MRFINKKSAPNKERTKELLELKKQIMASQTAILSLPEPPRTSLSRWWTPR